MAKKKILFIHPSAYDEHGNIIKDKQSWYPSRTLPYLAALTPECYDVRIIDENIDDIDFKADVDIVVLTGLGHNVIRAIDIARIFKTRSITTIIGGIGAYVLPDVIRNSGVFNTYVIGEADDLWHTILEDFEKSQLAAEYICKSPPSLSGMPFPRWDLVNLNNYMNVPFHNTPWISVETGRGCPNNCSYCSVSRYFGRKMRFRPIADVVKEIQHFQCKTIVFTDDNLAANTDRASELFHALKPLKIRWFGQFETKFAQNLDLVKQASQSGCFTVFMGIESLDSNNLNSVNKAQNAKVKISEAVQNLHKAGIQVMASMMFGMDHDTVDSISRTIDAMINSEVDYLIPWILSPIPGTPLHDSMKKENRILHNNYSLYTGTNSIIKPLNMTTSELTEAYWNGLRRFYSMPKIITRVCQGRKHKLFRLLMNLHIRSNSKKNLHPFTGKRIIPKIKG